MVEKRTQASCRVLQTDFQILASYNEELVRYICDILAYFNTVTTYIENNNLFVHNTLLFPAKPNIVMSPQSSPDADVEPFGHYYLK